MEVKLKLKEILKEKKISLRKLEELTGIERHRLSEIEEDIDKILLIEAIIISENLGIRISELYEVRNIELQ